MKDLINTKGTIKEILENNSFTVELENELIIKATISGKQKLYLSKPLQIGEIVPIVLSPYDITRGRINF